MANDLSKLLQQATTVRIARVGAFDARHRGATLAVVSDTQALNRLGQCLAIKSESLDEQIRLMTPGDLDLHFMFGHRLTATITFVAPSFVRWERWPGDARLAEPDALIGWLRQNGVSLGRAGAA